MSTFSKLLPVIKDGMRLTLTPKDCVGGDDFLIFSGRKKITVTVHTKQVPYWLEFDCDEPVLLENCPEPFLRTLLVNARKQKKAVPESITRNTNAILDRLLSVKDEALAAARELLKALGGKVNVLYYHDVEECDRYSFFDVDDDGDAVELFVERLHQQKDGTIEIWFGQDAGFTEFFKKDSDLNAADAFNLLLEIEQVHDVVTRKKPGSRVVTK